MQNHPIQLGGLSPKQILALSRLDQIERTRLDAMAGLSDVMRGVIDQARQTVIVRFDENGLCRLPDDQLVGEQEAMAYAQRLHPDRQVVVEFLMPSPPPRPIGRVTGVS